MTVGGRWTLATVVFGATLMAPGVAVAQMQCEPCTVGVVLDGPWERNDEVRAFSKAKSSTWSGTTSTSGSQRTNGISPIGRLPVSRPRSMG